MSELSKAIITLVGIAITVLCMGISIGRIYKDYNDGLDVINNKVYKQVGLDMSKYTIVYGSNDNFKTTRKMMVINEDDNVVYEIKGAFTCLKNNSNNEYKVVYRYNNDEYRYDNIEIGDNRVYLESLGVDESGENVVSTGGEYSVGSK